MRLNELRVLHVVSHFPPDRVGGVGQVASHIHSGLIARGADSHVLTSGPTTSDPLVRRISSSPNVFGVRSARHADWASTFDIVHTHHGEALPLLEKLHRRPLRPKLLMTLHVDNTRIARANRPVTIDGERIGSWRSSITQVAFKAPAKHLLDRRAMNLVDQLSFISRAGAVELLGGEGHDASVVYNGVPRAEIATDKPHPVEILYVGTGGQRKRVDLLPAILSEVRTTIPSARLRIVGVKRTASLDAAFSRHGITEAVEFVGPVLAEELGPYYQAADVLVCPSAYEGLPMVLMEALAHGLPVVATNVGGTSELVDHGDSGFLSSPDDAVSLARHLVQVLEDSTWRGQAGERGKELIRSRFSVPNQIENYLELYDSLLSEHERIHQNT